MGNKEIETKVKVKEVNNEKAEKIYWDELAVANADVSKLAINVVKQIKALVEANKKAIDDDEVLLEKIKGFTNLVEEIKKDIFSFANLHTDKATKKFRVGEVSEDPKEIELFLSIAMGYSGLTDRIANVLNNALITLSGEIVEKAKGAKNGE